MRGSRGRGGIYRDDSPTIHEWLQNGFENRTDSTITFTNGTTLFSVQPSGTNFSYWRQGKKFTSTGATYTIDDTADGQHWLYFDGDGALQEIKSPSDAQVKQLIEDECLVAMVYWNTNTSEGYLFDERHGYQMSPRTHHYLHDSLGMQWGSGVAVATIDTDQDGSANSHAQFGNTAGKVWDEDVEHSINAVESTTGYEVWWWDGTRWQWDTNAGYPFLVGATPYPQYNNFGAGTLVEAGNTNFVLVHLFTLSAADGNPIIIAGQAVYTTKPLALIGAATEMAGLLLGNLPSPELKPIASVLLECKLAYTNDVNARTVTISGDDYIDWRNNPLSGIGATASDHGSLSGLDDPADHDWAASADGRAGGQTIYGGTGASENLELDATSNATKGVVFVPSGTQMGIGTSSVDTSAALEIDSTTGALLPPRMTTAQRNALTAVNGMILYDSTLHVMYQYINGAWTAVPTATGYGISQLVHPPGLRVDTVTTRTINSGATHFVHMGRCPNTTSSIDVGYKVTGAAVGVTWAEVAIYTGTPTHQGTGTLSRAGYTDVSGVITSTGLKSTTVTASVAAGTEFWIAIGNDTATTDVILRAGAQDDIQSGSHLIDTLRPSTSASPSPTLASATARTIWVDAFVS